MVDSTGKLNGKKRKNVKSSYLAITEKNFAFQRKKVTSEAITYTNQLVEMINSWKAENRASNGKKAAEVKSLKVVEVNKIIKTATESSGYGELQFEKPEIGRFVVVPFVVQDLKVERHEYDSRQCLKKTIIKALYGSNWSLVGKSVDYRAGYLCGKLMCSETAKQF